MNPKFPITKIRSDGGTRSEVEALGEGRSPHSTEGGAKGPEIGPGARVVGRANGAEQRSSRQAK